jgi:hypothetical protein
MKSIKNLQHVMERKSFPDFLKAMNHVVDIKEWSETGGVFNLCRNLLRTFDPDVIYDVGCGRRPTLGALMALNYKKKVVCIDPQLDLTAAESILRLFKYSATLGDYLRESAGTKHQILNVPTLVLANHSHVSKKEVFVLIQKLRTWVYITVPCCVDNRLNNRACVSYKDIHMHSPRNDVFIYASNPALIRNLL